MCCSYILTYSFFQKLVGAYRKILEFKLHVIEIHHRRKDTSVLFIFYMLPRSFIRTLPNAAVITSSGERTVLLKGAFIFTILLLPPKHVLLRRSLDTERFEDIFYFPDKGL